MEKENQPKIIATEKGGPGEPPIKAITEEVEPNLYDIEITPEMWKQNMSTYECEIELPMIRESCVAHLYPNDDMIMNKSDDRKVAMDLLHEIYDDGHLSVKTDNGKIKCRFIGDKPVITIYAQLEELPFFDVPASKLGL